MSNKYIVLRVTTLRKRNRDTRLRMIDRIRLTPAVIDYSHEVAKIFKKSLGCRKCLIELFKGDPKMGKIAYSEQC